MSFNPQSNQSKFTIEGRKIQNYLLVKELGSGQFGKVWKATHEKTGETYAVKVIKRSKIESNSILKRLLETEVSIMNSINHPNILHLFDFFESSNNYYLVLNYCNQGDFEQYLENNKLKKLPEEKAIYFLKQIMNGFQKLREFKVLHRDFKLANIFMHNDTIVIGDFGFAKQGVEMAQTYLGTPLTQAYEILTADKTKDLQYSSKADLWSVGVVYYQMLYGDYPFFGMSIPDLISDVKKKVKNFTFPYDNQISEDSKDLIRQLLQPDPNKRISFSDFFNHKIFNKVSHTLSDNIDNDLQNLGQLLKKNLNIDAEFNQNKINSEKNDKVNFLDQQGLLNYGHQKKPAQITEQNINKHDIDKNIVQSIVENRYDHERQKIFFMIYTVKKIQKTLKNKKNIFPTLNNNMFLISILIMKKADILNNCNLQIVYQKKNVYQLDDQVLKSILNGPIHNQLIDYFAVNSQKMKDYINLIQQRMNENNVFNPFQDILVQQNPPLQQIDELIMQQLNAVKQQYMYGSLFFQTLDDKRNLMFIILSVQYSVQSEIKFPYQVNNFSFNWNSFYNDHEQKTLQALLNEIGL